MTDPIASLAVPPGLRVVVTAGAAGIGRATIEALLAHDARIVTCDVDDAALAEFSAACPQAHAIHADVSDEADVDRLFAAAQSRLGGLDALVNNAGIAGPTGPVESLSPEDWRRCVEVCLTGQFLCTRLAVPMLKSAGGGAIINLSSAAGRFGLRWRTPYTSAKFGVIGFTQSLSKELGPANIRVNAICPGSVAGPRIERVFAARARQLNKSIDEIREAALSQVSMHRLVTAQDIAGTVLWLLSAAGTNVSGQTLGIDAGQETL